KNHCQTPSCRRSDSFSRRSLCRSCANGGSVEIERYFPLIANIVHYAGVLCRKLSPLCVLGALGGLILKENATTEDTKNWMFSTKHAGEVGQIKKSRPHWAALTRPYSMNPARGR